MYVLALKRDFSVTGWNNTFQSLLMFLTTKYGSTCFLFYRIMPLPSTISWKLSAVFPYTCVTC